MVRAKQLIGREIDATEFLTSEHMHVESLFNRFWSAEDPRRKHEIFNAIRDELLMHMSMEEEVLYPACMEHESMRRQVLEDIEEHHQAKLMLHEAEQMSMKDERTLAKIKVVMEDIEHHVEEEEGELFPVARRVFSKPELRDLRDRMLAQKRAFLTQQAKPKKTRRAA